MHADIVFLQYFCYTFCKKHMVHCISAGWPLACQARVTSLVRYIRNISWSIVRSYFFLNLLVFERKMFATSAGAFVLVLFCGSSEYRAARLLWLPVGLKRYKLRQGNYSAQVCIAHFLTVYSWKAGKPKPRPLCHLWPMQTMVQKISHLESLNDAKYFKCKIIFLGWNITSYLTVSPILGHSIPCYFTSNVLRCVWTAVLYLA